MVKFLCIKKAAGILNVKVLLCLEEAVAQPMLLLVGEK